MAHARMIERRQAKFMARIVADTLGLQELNMMVVVGIVIRQPHMVVDYWLDQQISRQLSQISSDEIKQLVPFMRVLPSHVASSLVECLGIVSSCEKYVKSRSALKPCDHRTMGGDAAWFRGVAEKVRDLRRHLCDWAEVEDDDPGTVLNDTVAVVLDEAADEKRRFDQQARQEGPAA